MSLVAGVNILFTTATVPGVAAGVDRNLFITLAAAAAALPLFTSGVLSHRDDDDVFGVIPLPYGVTTPGVKAVPGVTIPPLLCSVIAGVASHLPLVFPPPLGVPPYPKPGVRPPGVAPLGVFHPKPGVLEPCSSAVNLE